MDTIVFLVIFLVLAAVFIAGIALGDTDGEPLTDTPDMIRRSMRGLRPGVRLMTAFMLLGHAWTNPFVEGLVAAGVPNRRARPAGRFLAGLAAGTLLYGVWLLAQTPN